MKKTILLSMLLALSLGSTAQGLAEKGRTCADLVPKGWTCQEERGDLNKDGREDLVVIALSNDEKGLRKRDDGYVYNLNQPVLAIYFGQADGTLSRWKEYPTLLLANPSETLSYIYSLKIAPKGALIIAVDPFASAGTWQQSTYGFTYRYQDGDFYLIGKDEDSYARNSGEGEQSSYNYLTHKCQRVTYNLFEKKKPVERWTKIAAEPLRKLGADRIPYEP